VLRNLFATPFGNSASEFRGLPNSPSKLRLPLALPKANARRLNPGHREAHPSINHGVFAFKSILNIRRRSSWWRQNLLSA